MSQPEFIDNQSGNTLAVALRARVEHLAATLKEPPALDIATGYFNPGGFASLADALEKVSRVRLLLGAEPMPPPVARQRRLGDPRGERYEALLTREALKQFDAGILRDRDQLTFDAATDRAIRTLLTHLESGRIEVRRYEKRFLHGKAFLFSGRNGVISGSSNFTTAGLQSNLELNLGHYQPSVIQQVETWFEGLWVDAVPYDLAALYEARYEDYAPYLIFLRILFEKYGGELAEEAGPGGAIHLTRFQTDGLDRAQRILERYNGVLVADGVGLGKTFLAGEMLRRVIERNRQRALLVAPAALRDGTWERFRSRFQLGLEVISFEQLADDVQLGGSRPHLKAPVDEYSMIVVDEAHAFRTLDTRRAEALRRLLRGDPPKKLVLMTATPVNNSLWDLYDLLTYFVQHDAVFADLGITSLKKRFDVAAKQDPFALKPDVLFDVLDTTTVRRTRHFVQRFYPHDTVERGDGTRVAIQFPTPHVTTATYDLEAVLPGLFAHFAELLQPETGDPALKLARYSPGAFRRGAADSASEAALLGLIRSGLLKRFESSVHAFQRTVAGMVEGHDVFLRGLAEGRLLSAADIETARQADEEGHPWEELAFEPSTIDPSELDLPRLRQAVAEDRELLKRLRDRAATLASADDPKLHLLRDHLVNVAALAARDATTPEEERNRRKVIIFSYFADTVDWIVEYLRNAVETDRRLAAYRGRVVAVRGNDSWEGVTREAAVFGFAPQSTDAPPGKEEDRFDILVTTDVLAEGMNLQQAARIVNYDLPWNPMRLVQRHGRIDRIGSPHRDVHITCILPAAQIEAMLALEDRLRRKLAQAAASIGLDSAPLPDVAVTDHYFSDTIAEINRLRDGNASLFETAGEAAHAYSGEEYRQELRKGLQRWGDAVAALPGGAGSGLCRGSVPGHVFCARIAERVFLRFVPLDPSAEIERDSLDCLQLVSCGETTPRQLPDTFRETAYAAWARARDDVFAEWQRAADPANLQPEIRPLFRAAAAHVRQYRPPEMSLEDVERLADTLEAPRGLRVERQLRKFFTADSADGAATTRAIAEAVRELGLQPWKAPDPLPPIDPVDIQLVVWMAVIPEGDGR